MKVLNQIKKLTEAVRRCSAKQVLLEISQNSQENTCSRVSLACNFIKKMFSIDDSLGCEFCEISKSTFFHRTPLAAASKLTQIMSSLNSTHFLIMLILSFFFETRLFNHQDSYAERYFNLFYN